MKRRIVHLISFLVALIVPLVAVASSAVTVQAQSSPAQPQPEAAVVQIALWATIRKDGVASDRKQPIGSGSIVSPGGLILTNHHVIDTTAFRRNLEVEKSDQERQGHEFTFSLVEHRYVILIAGPSGIPVATYTAGTAVDDPLLDLAVLQIDGGPQGEPIALPPLPYLELGDSDQVRRGDRLELLGFPGDVSALFSSSAEIGSLLTEEGVVGRAWIVVGGATVSGGSSGGPALDASGRLVAVTTSVPVPECRPVGDTNGDGIVDQADTCLPVGGTFARLRPVNLALPLLRQADFIPTPTPSPEPTRAPLITIELTATPEPTSTPLPTPTPTSLPTPTPEPVIREPRFIPLASLLPETPVLPQRQPFRLYSEDSASFDDVYTNLPDPAQARDLLLSWGWLENAYRVYTSDTPPPGAIGWLELSVDRFASADGAAQALPYYAAARRAQLGYEPVDIVLFGDQSQAMAGMAFNGTELTIFSRRGNLIFRATGIAANGDPTADVYEALLFPLRLVVDEPEVVSPELFTALPQAFALPSGLAVSQEHARSAASIADGFPDTIEAQQLFQAWGWRESASRIFTGQTANGTHRLETVVFRLADSQAAAEALEYFLDERAEALDLTETAPPPAQADEVRAVTGVVADGNEATVYVRRGRDLYRLTAFGGANPMGDLAMLLATW